MQGSLQTDLNKLSPSRPHSESYTLPKSGLICVRSVYKRTYSIVRNQKNTSLLHWYDKMSEVKFTERSGTTTYHKEEGEGGGGGEGEGGGKKLFLLLQRSWEKRHREAQCRGWIASNAGTNRWITLSANAGHNAGQQAVQGRENAGKRVTILPQRHTSLPKGTTPIVCFKAVSRMGKPEISFSRCKTRA